VSFQFQPFLQNETTEFVVNKTFLCYWIGLLLKVITKQLLVIVCSWKVFRACTGGMHQIHRVRIKFYICFSTTINHIKRFNGIASTVFVQIRQYKRPILNYIGKYCGQNSSGPSSPLRTWRTEFFSNWVLKSVLPIFWGLKVSVHQNDELHWWPTKVLVILIMQ
jgi:hypothetical protein